MNRAALGTILLALSFSACSVTAPLVTPECATSDDCGAGRVCMAETCTKLCNIQSDCEQDTVCGSDGYCIAIGPGNAPEIESVKGNGARADGGKIDNGLVVDGAQLARAVFELRQGNTATRLDVVSQSDARVELLLPIDVESGGYTLTATNQAGTNQTGVTLELPDLTGNVLLTRINDEATDQFAARLIPAHDHDTQYYTRTEVDALTDPAAVQSRVTGACSGGQAIESIAEDGTVSCVLASATDCPPTYTRDTSRADIVLCQRGADEMVKVGDFWVDRYEASIWSSPDCSGTEYGVTTDDYPATFPNNGHWSSPLYACSAAAVPASASMTWFQANQACLLSGKHLISNAEWQSASAGTVDPGAVDAIAGGDCHTDGGTKRVTGLAGTTPGGAGSCISRWGAEDMTGNVDEWTSDWGVAGQHWSGTPAALADIAWSDGIGSSQTPWPDSTYGDDVTVGVAGRSHNGVGWTLGSIGATGRGGDFTQAAAAGAFTVDLRDGPSFSWFARGFRCARTK